MKSGATFIVAVRSDITNIATVSKAIFTLKGNETITKEYPGGVTFSDGTFLIPLTQQETTKLATDKGHTVLIEGQFNFTDKSVTKSETVKTYISATLATSLVTGNTPSAYQLDEIQIKVMDGVIIAHVNVDEVEEAVQECEDAVDSVESVIASANEVIAETRTAISNTATAINNANTAANNANTKASYADYEGNQAKQKGDYAVQKTEEMQTYVQGFVNDADARVDIAVANAESATASANASATQASRVNATVSKANGIATISVTDKNNEIHIAKVYDGQDGQNGQDGAPGSNIIIDSTASAVQVLQPSDIGFTDNASGGIDVKLGTTTKTLALESEVNTLSEDISNLDDTLDIHICYADLTDFETGYYSLADSGRINKNDSNTGFKKVKISSLPSGSYNISKCRGFFSIVEPLEGGTPYKLATTDKEISGVVTITEKSNLYISITASQTSFLFVSSDDSIPEFVDSKGVYSYVLKELEGGKTIKVEKDGSGDFTTIKAALEYSLKHPHTTIYVGNGEYDIIEEFGDDYFANFTGGSRAGLKLDNYVHIIFASNSKVVCNYLGDNNKVKKDFSPFNTIADGNQQKGFILENLNLECSNVRYAIHDETSGQVNPYRNIYKNCHIVLDNSNNTQGYQQCIGGGLGASAEIVIENCYFESIHANATYDIVSYHNGGNGKSNIVITGCYFAGKDRCRCSNYGPSTQVSTMIVSNCSLGSEPRIIDEVSGANQNMQLIKWNNEIRNN